MHFYAFDVYISRNYITRAWNLTKILQDKLIYGRQSAQSWMEYQVIRKVLCYISLANYLARYGPCVGDITIETYRHACFVLPSCHSFWLSAWIHVNAARSPKTIPLPETHSYHLMFPSRGANICRKNIFITTRVKWLIKHLHGYYAIFFLLNELSKVYTTPINPIETSFHSGWIGPVSFDWGSY